MRKLFAFLFFYLAIQLGVSEAQICSSVPNTFTPGTTILSSQVNGNFAAIISCLNSNAATLGINSDISSLTGLGNNGILGVVNGSSAGVGYVGQVVSSDIPTGSAISLSNGVTANITSVSLTAGDWDCFGNYQLKIPSPPASGVNVSASIGTTSATIGTEVNGLVVTNSGSNSATGNGGNLGTVQENISITTLIYMTVNASFSSGTVSAYGFLGCRRRR